MQWYAPRQSCCEVTCVTRALAAWQVILRKGSENCMSRSFEAALVKYRFEDKRALADFLTVCLLYFAKSARCLD